MFDVGFGGFSGFESGNSVSRSIQDKGHFILKMMSVRSIFGIFCFFMSETKPHLAATEKFLSVTF
jgi:hypothetical protein